MRAGAYVVPPTLLEVRQPVTEGDLHHLEHQRAHVAHLAVAEDQRLPEPAQKVGDEVHLWTSRAPGLTSNASTMLPIEEVGCSGVNTRQSSA